MGKVINGIGKFYEIYSSPSVFDEKTWQVDICVIDVFLSDHFRFCHRLVILLVNVLSE